MLSTHAESRHDPLLAALEHELPQVGGVPPSQLPAGLAADKFLSLCQVQWSISCSQGLHLQVACLGCTVMWRFLQNKISCWLQEMQDIIGKGECLPFTGKALHQHASEFRGDASGKGACVAQGGDDVLEAQHASLDTGSCFTSCNGLLHSIRNWHESCPVSENPGTP